MTPALTKALDLHPPGQPARLGHTQPPEERLRNIIRRSIAEDNWLDKIAAFRKMYGIDIHNNEQPGIIDGPAYKRQQLQMDMLNEELGETWEAANDGNFPEYIDGLLDLIYVAIGALFETGLKDMQIRRLMQEVHASNMTKVGDDGRPVFREDGKVLKGGNYVQADIAGLLADMLGTVDTSQETD